MYQLKRIDVVKCPHFIMVLDHYRDDGSCRCDDITDVNMVSWGYVWDDEKKSWVAE